MEDTQQYELVYGLGGHGGPYTGLENAKKRAHELLEGHKLETAVYVVPYSAPTFHAKHHVYVALKCTCSCR